MKVALLRLDGLEEAMLAASCCVSAEMPTEPNPKALLSAVRAGHLSVAEHAVATFSIEGISRACSHQLVRHRIASYSQQSQRYVKMDKIECIVPKSVYDAIESDLMNGGGWNPNGCLQDDLKDLEWVFQRFVKKARELNVPEEDIRYYYPQGITTNIVVTMNARELRHMAEERMCSRAQWEIRELVSEMVRQAKEAAPVLFEDAGPKCIRLGYCPEERGCGKVPRRGE